MLQEEPKPRSNLSLRYPAFAVSHPSSMYPVNVCQDRRGGVPPSRLVGISQPEEDPLKFRLNMGPLALAGSCANACMQALNLYSRSGLSAHITYMQCVIESWCHPAHAASYTKSAITATTVQKYLKVYTYQYNITENRWHY